MDFKAVFSSEAPRFIIAKLSRSGLLISATPRGMDPVKYMLYKEFERVSIMIFLTSKISNKKSAEILFGSVSLIMYP